MNLTDLSAELLERAEAVPSDPAVTRLAAVRTRVRAHRRRQAAVAAVVAAGCAAAVAFGVAGTTTRATHGTDPAGHHRVAPDTFDDVLAGDPLVTSVVGRKGQAEVVLRFTPAATNLSLTEFCHLAKESSRSAVTTVNGHPVAEGSCERSTVANGSSWTAGSGGAAQIEGAWAALGVVPGRESVIRIRLQTRAGAPATDPSVRLGIGIYALTGERIVSDGVVIKKDAESDGHDYRLTQYVTRPVGPGVHRVDLQVPAGRWPVYVRAGTVGDVAGKDSTLLTRTIVDGHDGAYVESQGGGDASELLPDARAHSVGVRTDGSSGVLLLACYVRVD